MQNQLTSVHSSLCSSLFKGTLPSVSYWGTYYDMYTYMYSNTCIFSPSTGYHMYCMLFIYEKNETHTQSSLRMHFTRFLKEHRAWRHAFTHNMVTVAMVLLLHLGTCGICLWLDNGKHVCLSGTLWHTAMTTPIAMWTPLNMFYCSVLILGTHSRLLLNQVC